MLIDEIRKKEKVSVAESLVIGYAAIRSNITAVLFVLLIIYFPINLLSGYISLSMSNIGASIDLTSILSSPEMIEEFVRTPEYMSLLRDENIIFLDNEKSEIYVNDIKISLYGLTIERKYYKRFSKLKMPKDYINGFLGEPDKDGINILMAHTPKYMKDYMNWGADISLCGHYHGGVMQLGKNRGLVSPDPSFFPYNAHGKFEEDNKIAIISAGLGEHTIPVRVHNPRELVSVDVYIQ